MKAKTFKTWLLAQRARPDVVGHLAADFWYDFRDTVRHEGEPPLPQRFTPCTAFAYLNRRVASDKALKALLTAEREWLAYRVK